MKFKGLYTALITPFNDDLSIDFDGFKKNIEFQIESGVDGLLPLGTTGETPTLSSSEISKVIKFAVEQVNKRVPVMIGTSTNCTQTTINNTKQAKELGADAVLISAPYYNRPTQEGIFKHFEAITQAVDIPIMVYNIPGRTAVNIETSTLERISDLKNITSVKEASGNLSQMMEVISSIQDKKEDFAVLSGDDSLTLPLMSLGGKGIVSVASNLVPKEVKELVTAVENNNYDLARQIHYKLLPLFTNAFIETNPAPIKKAMQIVGMAAGGTRLPISEMKQESIQVMNSTLKNMNLI